MSSHINNTKKVLLVMPSYRFIYEGTHTKKVAIYSPTLNLAVIAGALISKGHSVKILDLNKRDEKDLVSLIKNFDPDYIGVTFVTPMAEEAFHIAALAKKIKKDIVLIAGGAHSSAIPGSVLESSEFDVVCIGEGDYTILNIVEDKPYRDIKGIAFRDNGKLSISRDDNFIKDLDNLPFPAWDLFNIEEYKTARIMTRKNPAGWIETSRGCPYGCTYCNKKVFGHRFRTKSAKRVVDEIEHMLSCGFREIHIADDCFTYDIERAKKICEEIIKRKLKFPWATVAGIRADRVDQELLNLMRKSGCYRLYYGIESGDEGILRLIRKGETCDDVRRAVKMSKKAGLEAYGFFMFALPGETEQTMQRTIDFAKELDLDMAKATITVPLPATPHFEALYKDGRIKETRWSKYNLYFPARDLYNHPNLDWDTIESYYRKFYREFYLRPRFVIKRLIRSLRQGELINDIKDFFRTSW